MLTGTGTEEVGKEKTARIDKGQGHVEKAHTIAHDKSC